MPCAIAARVSESQGVEQGNRARTHCEDVAHDSADSCRRALDRLDRGWMVVRLDLECHREPVADVHYACILSTWRDQKPITLVRQGPQQSLGVLVSAMLTPEGTEQS